MRDGWRDVTGLSISATSPASFTKTVIVGSSVRGNLPQLLAISGHTTHARQTALDFHTIPHPGEFGYETWPKDAWQ